MEASVPFVVRGEFIYHDTLIVDVGGALKRHARASPSELKLYLDGKAPKDQVAHWYEAQLIHYGLQRSKDKNTAKVRLQQALSQKRLTVPPHVLEMEAQMKKDYAAGIKRSRNAASKVAKVGVVDSPLPGGKKRKQSDADTEATTATSKRTKITMKVGDIEVSIDHDSGGAKRTGTKNKAVSCNLATTSSPAKGKAVSGPTSTRKPSVTPRTRKTTQNDT